MELDVYAKKEEKNVGGRDWNVILQRALSVHVSGAACSCVVRRKKTTVTKPECSHSATIVQSVMGCEARPSLWVGRSQPGVCALSTLYGVLPSGWKQLSEVCQSLAEELNTAQSVPISHCSFPLIFGEVSIAVFIFSEWWNESVRYNTDVIPTASATKEEDFIQDSISGSFSSRACQTPARIFKNWCICLTCALYPLWSEVFDVPAMQRHQNYMTQTCDAEQCNFQSRKASCEKDVRVEWRVADDLATNLATNLVTLTPKGSLYNSTNWTNSQFGRKKN